MTDRAHERLKRIARIQAEHQRAEARRRARERRREERLEELAEQSAAAAELDFTSLTFTGDDAHE